MNFSGDGSLEKYLYVRFHTGGCLVEVIQGRSKGEILKEKFSKENHICEVL